MSSMYGEKLKISIFGQSHSEAIGVIVDGLPAGFKIDMDSFKAFMSRRAPGKNAYSSQRKEADEVKFLSGLVNGITCGAPLCAVICNTDVRSRDYDNILDIPRPSHADYAAQLKYGGWQDVRGGGHFSGRLTAPLCAAGAICIQLLKQRGITVGSHIYSISDVKDLPFDMADIPSERLERLAEKEFPVNDDGQGTGMREKIEEARLRGDSVGGIIECAVAGMPAGVGDPIFGGIENKISCAVFGIPAVKGIEFGAGFESASKTGSQNNDPFYIDKDGNVKTVTNNHGGILGGISSGMPIIFRAAVKPTPSIGMEQKSVSLKELSETTLIISGRHDPCIVPRAVPCIEAAAAVAIADLLI